MELNREQIIKALECCTSEVTIEFNCTECPYIGKGCNIVVMRDALSLIKELTEENERLKTRYVSADNLIIAETVRKMQERLKAQKLTHKNFGELVCVEDIDQIAKGMLEGL